MRRVTRTVRVWSSDGWSSDFWFLRMKLHLGEGKKGNKCEQTNGWHKQLKISCKNDGIGGLAATGCYQ